MRKRNSKTIFAETLLELSRNQPLDRITVKQIVEESGLSMQTFYNHFRDKEELIFYIHKAEGDRISEAFMNGDVSFEELSRRNMAFYMEHRDYMVNALTNTSASDPYIRQTADNACHLFRKYLKEKCGLDPIPPDLDVQLILYIYGITGLYADLAFGRCSYSPEEVLKYGHDGMPPRLRSYLIP